MNEIAQLEAEHRRRSRTFLVLLAATALLDGAVLASGVGERVGLVAGMSLGIWLFLASVVVLATAGGRVAAVSRRLRAARILQRTA